MQKPSQFLRSVIALPRRLIYCIVPSVKYIKLGFGWDKRMIVLIISAVLFILLLYMGVFTLVHMDNQKRQETCETQLVSYECQSIEFLVGTGGICLCKREPPQDHTAVYLVRE